MNLLSPLMEDKHYNEMKEDKRHVLCRLVVTAQLQSRMGSGAAQGGQQAVSSPLSVPLSSGIVGTHE